MVYITLLKVATPTPKVISHGLISFNGLVGRLFTFLIISGTARVGCVIEMSLIFSIQFQICIGSLNQFWRSRSSLPLDSSRGAESGLTTRWSGRTGDIGGDAEAICRRSDQPLDCSHCQYDGHRCRVRSLMWLLLLH
jgi:hypothetical protein